VYINFSATVNPIVHQDSIEVQDVTGIAMDSQSFQKLRFGVIIERLSVRVSNHRQTPVLDDFLIMY
jgi:hypothetical protein